MVTVTDKKQGVDVSGSSADAEYYLADVSSAQDNFAFGGQMQGRNFNPTISSYGFGGQLKDDEIYGSGNSYSTEYWQYDPRLGRRWNIDPLTYPWQSSYQSFNGNPIYYVDPSGLEGETGDGTRNRQEEKQGSSETFYKRGGGDGSVEIIVDRGKASQSWYNFMEEFVMSGGYEAYRAELYEYKIKAYQDGLGKLAYGSTNGVVNVPESIKIRVSEETDKEALPSLKSAWAAGKSGVDPNSIEFMLNPFARASYYQERAYTVTTKNEGWELVSSVGTDVAFQWLGRFSLISKATVELKQITNSIWELGAVRRGRIIEAVLSKSTYSNWSWTNTISPNYPVVDFIEGLNVVSLKTTNAAVVNYTKNINQLGALRAAGYNPTLHIVTPKGHVIKNINNVLQQAEANGVNVIFSTY